MDAERIERINNLLSQVGKIRSSGNQRLLSEIVSKTPFVGKRMKNRKKRRKYETELRGLDRLVDAFNEGYVPGGINGEPQEWAWVSQVGSYDYKYHPDNKNFMTELSEIYSKAREDGTKVSSNTPREGYGLAFTVTALMDIQGLSPLMKNRPRKLEYGNTDAAYWIDWATEIKGYIKNKIKELNIQKKN